MVVAQTSPSSGLMTAPFALVYSLTYVNKDASSEGVIIYEDLQNITLRLDLNFGPLIVNIYLLNSFLQLIYIFVYKYSFRFQKKLMLRTEMPHC